MQDACINTNVFFAYAIRPASSMKAVQKSASIQQVKLLVHWSLNSNTFEEYYHLPQDQHQHG
ncbi:hypothetical protein BCV72DRAFT_323066 [Rhizopus microsporus var. microsporus]|uniref:Uncharacterized protein n=1 Tax=Rhizopus microsporus var. microsporus TaxID=86635 RepID=A0A1X0R9P4_RHIZD|nr:hypothetical protein BCV72DRAFT_323066 [Rhizopus microsporus var. microsporus]